jgi:16S rRNA (adenine1518-N6/adenine1519-N6)-dimethyltransferase
MIKAKKSLGQNFLKSGQVAMEIAAAGNIQAGDLVLEIGPGKGILTEKILKLGGTVVCVEKDRELISILQDKFKNEIEVGKLRIIPGDILEFDPQKELAGKKYKIIANIPYYITGLILKNFLEARHQPTDMVLLVQKEVAQRIMARNEKESILSISIKAYGEPEIIRKVSQKLFSPEPKVDSAVLAIRKISKKLFSENKIPEKDFFEVLKAGFSHKRKVISSNIPLELSTRLLKCGINPKSRAENLKLKDWVCLAKKS